jgi:hypothetical protein
MNPIKQKAVKVRTEIPEAKQLQTFVRNLGSTEPAELYMVGTLAYINIDLLLPILSITEKWFIDNSVRYDPEIFEIPHYVVIKKGIYVNKYGITKLIAQSREAVAFKLQDYIYEVIYKLEKNGTVTMSEIDSRKELERTILHYQEVQNRNLEELKEYEDEMRSLELNIYELNAKNEQLIIESKHKDELIHEYEEELNRLTGICNILGKYVKKKKPNCEALDDIDIESDEDINASDATIAIESLKQSKKALRKLETKRGLSETKRGLSETKRGLSETKRGLSETKNIKTEKKVIREKEQSRKKNSNFYLIRSNEPFYQDYYRWAIKTELPTQPINAVSHEHEELLYDSYIDYSKAVLNGYCIPNPSYMFIYYRDLHIDAQTNKIISLLLIASVFRSEDIDAIINQNGW